MDHRERLDSLEHLAEREILILDGAMGSLIQGQGLTGADYQGAEFAAHPVSLAGCHDALCITRPEIIIAIHEAYLEAGAGVITTCSFNANALSLADYGLADRAYDISRAAAHCARVAADKHAAPGRPRFVAGSMGPTGKSLSVASDLNDPGKRAVTWSEMEAAYYDNARGLVDGGADILLIETVFDTLNAKAALFAVSRLMEERGRDIPVIVSATISDASGRMLCGQTVEAFVVSVLHAKPWALGLNCALGAELMLPHLEALAACSPARVCCYPNAGLPDRLGAYGEGPEETARFLEEFFMRGLVNIAGGCCGTTPAHIARIARTAARYAPRKPPAPRRDPAGMLAGLEVLDPDSGFIDIGERTNVAGSRKFLGLVERGRWDEASGVAREMIAAGAGIIDVCMDDALLDGKAAMVRFLNLCLSDPAIARVPVMADSSSWDTLEAALQCMQGRGVINSLSLKEGEAEFLRRAGLVRRYGAAAAVMLFDEEGQAVTFEQKTAVAGRCYTLLTGAGFPPGGIIFDPNVLTIATGMAGHDRYALDFIRACSWIREHCPGARISAGVSNLSFSFRGNETVRRAMHAVFLKHAALAGLSMAIVNPAALISYGEVPPELRSAAEDAVLCRGENPSERLIALALQTRRHGGPESGGASSNALKWREQDPEARVEYALLNGLDADIEADVLELKARLAPLQIIEGPLMKAMRETGRRFGEGALFLPQVIRCARVMKKAVAALEPFMEQAEADAPASGGKIIMATVKGDVHDIGKNIAGLVIACNGYKVIDLGVMVPSEQILDAAEREKAGAVGLSGLISPSLEEMVRVAEAMERRGFTIPLLIGGAAASLTHTALRIAPAYSGPVVYVRDAGESAVVLHALFSRGPAHERDEFLSALYGEYGKARARYGTPTGSAAPGAAPSKPPALSLEAARAKRLASDWVKNPPPEPQVKGAVSYNDYPLAEIVPRINWEAFYRFWEMNGPARSRPGSAAERESLRADADRMLARIAAEKTLDIRGVLGFFPAFQEGDDAAVCVEDGAEQARFCFLRNQGPEGPNLCLADYLPPKGAAPGWIGLFALSAGFGCEQAAAAYRNQGDDYRALLLASLADRLTEAFSEALYRLVKETLWPSAYPLIRPAFGYPMAPDHHDKGLCFRLLEAEPRTGMTLTESGMILPAQSVCGMYFVHPQAAYFEMSRIDAGQLADWARRKGISEAEARRRIAAG